ncbi:MAG: hypothetical protein WAZ18_03765, partial [Alphaproteobacteria bacterium]
VTGLAVTKGLKHTSHGVVIDTIIGAYGAGLGVVVFGLLGITLPDPTGGLLVPVLGAFATHLLVKYIPVK